jgi:hypothetical protein
MSAAVVGTDLERRFFHTCQVATANGVTLHMSNTMPFWTNWAPRLAHHNDSLKHALISLGATYHLVKAKTVASRPAQSLDSVSSRYLIDRLDSFAIGQYNMAIHTLIDRISSNDSDGAIIVAACCLIFICIENLRSNFSNARAHLEKGSQILIKSFDVGHIFHQYFINLPPSHTTSTYTISQIISNEDLAGIINAYRQLEVAANLFSRNVPVALVSRLSATTQLDDGMDLPDTFRSLEEGFRQRVSLNTDVFAFNAETHRHVNDREFWESYSIRQKFSCLYSRNVAVEQKYQAYVSSRKDIVPGTRVHVSACLDLLQLRSMRTVLEMMPPMRGYLDSTTEWDAFGDILLPYAERAFDAVSAFIQKADSPIDFTVDGVSIAVLYILNVHSSRPDQKARTWRLVENYNIREGPWDRELVLKVFRKTQMATGRHPGSSMVWNSWTQWTDCSTNLSRLSDDVNPTE